MKTPLITVIIACYNSDQWINDTIESVARQEYQNWQLLICDDCSTDSSVQEIVRSLKELQITDKAQIHIHDKNEGYGYTLWDMTNWAKGEIIVILDSDDKLYNAEVLKKVSKVHCKYPDVSMTYSNYMECNEAMLPKRLYKTRQIVDAETYLEVVGDHMKKPEKVRISHLRAFKRIHYVATLGFDKNLTNTVDKDLTLKLEEVGKLMHIDDVLYLYRMHDKNISRTIGKQSQEVMDRIATDRKKVFDNARERRNRPPLKKWWPIEKCKALQTKWGDYDEFARHPARTKKDVIKVLRETIKSYPQPPSVIDIGCGAGHFMWTVKEMVSELTGIDSSPAMIALSREQFEKTEIIRPQFRNANCWNTGYPDNSFDLSYQVDVCMHVGDSWKSIVEMIRISRKHVIFTGPSFCTDLTTMIDRKFATGKRWKISVPLLVDRLEKLKECGTIKRFELKHRKPTPVYNHKILVITK